MLSPASDNWYDNSIRLKEADVYKDAIDLWQKIRRLTTEVEPQEDS